MTRRRITQIIIGAVGLHSLVLGTIMLLTPIPFLNWMGWSYHGPVFFPSQSGIYLLILGAAYFAGIFHRPFAWFLVTSKAIAVLFLLGHAMANTAPWPMMIQAALLDGLMGIAVTVALIADRDTPNLD